MRQDKQVFQITLTGVPNRVPTVIESMFLEGTVYDSLKEPLSSKGIKLSSVRVRSDKTIHYQRALDEQFTVAGATFTLPLPPPSSNSETNNNGLDLNVADLKMDQETLIRINQANRRVLEMGNDRAGGDSSIYQLSLLVTIVGIYSTTSDIDYTSSVSSAINQNQIDIVESLTQGSEYFEQVQFLVCVGVGFRDADDPLLEMTKSRSSTTSGTGSSGSKGSSLSTRGDTGESSPIHQQYHSYSLNSIENAQVNLERVNDSYSEGTSSSTTTSNSDQDPSAFEQADDLNQDSYTVFFNPEASRFQLISGTMFIVLCCITVLWNLVRVAAKKAAERKKRLTLAKEAYEGSSQGAVKGTKTFFNRNSKYTGTMDTGAGLQ